MHKPTDWAQLAKEAGLGAQSSGRLNDHTITQSPAWRKIPEFPDYYINRKGVVRNYRGMLIRNNSDKMHIRLRKDGKYGHHQRRKLLWAAWPELAPARTDEGIILYDGTEYREPPEFAGRYAISREGEVISIRRGNQKIKCSYRSSKSGNYFLYNGIKQVGRSRNLLVESAWRDYE